MRPVLQHSRTRLYLLISLCLLSLPAFCFSQVTICRAWNVNESLSNMITSWNPVNMWYRFN